jgi:osmotically inducible lipoprotein OsmB
MKRGEVAGILNRKEPSMKRAVKILIAAVVLPCLLVGCATATPTQKGAMKGAVVGGLAGQLIGGDTSATLIGAGAGALGGALLSDYRANK